MRIYSFTFFQDRYGENADKMADLVWNYTGKDENGKYTHTTFRIPASRETAKRKALELVAEKEPGKTLFYRKIYSNGNFYCEFLIEVKED